MRKKFRIRKILGLPSSSTQSQMGSSTNDSQQHHPQGPSTFYSQCNETPMSVFIAVINTGELSSLIKSGSPELGELAEAWANIVNEYYDITNDANAKHEWLLRAEYNINVLKYNIAVDVIKIATHHYSPALVESLKNLGFDYSFTADNYDDDIQSCKNELNAMRLKIRVQEQEVKQLDKNKEAKEHDKYYFDRMFIRLSKYMGQKIDAAKLTVAEYGFILIIISA